LVAVAALFVAVDTEAAFAGDAGTTERRGGQKYLPSEATEGPRELSAVDRQLIQVLQGQPFGKPWAEIVKTDPAPRDRRGLGAAETHAALSRDKMEIQDQAQFLEELAIAERFGFVSIQVLRVYRYGRLTGLQLVLERVGREPSAVKRFAEDLAELQVAWSNLPQRWGLDKTFRVTRNDLEKARGTEGNNGNSPLRIELEPRSERR
jgi:hypothetical protein